MHNRRGSRPGPVWKVIFWVSLIGALLCLAVTVGYYWSRYWTAREYEKQFPDIVRVIDQENRGHGGAWNHGTELATGKYLFYLDSDDWVDTVQFSKLIDFLSLYDVDIVLLDSKVFYLQKGVYKDVILNNIIPDQVYDANSFDWLGCGNGANITYAHNTVYRTSMMKQYLPLYCERVAYDDVSLQVIPIALAESFVYTKLNVYRYFVDKVNDINEN